MVKNNLKKKKIIKKKGYTKIFGESEREKVLKLCQNIISQVDQNYSGSIDFTEFLVAALNEEKLLNRKKIEQTFKMFDAVFVL